jgi:hypothetical protein
MVVRDIASEKEKFVGDWCLLRGDEGEIIYDQVLEQSRTGLDRCGIVGVAATMALPPEHTF